MSITKNIQSETAICRMALSAFPQKRMESCTELTEGMCNAAYLVKFSDGSKSVLKIAPGENKGLLSNEVNMMDAEVKAMDIVGKSGLIKVAEVQYYDTSKTICSSDYFFMEAIEGQSFFTAKESMSEEEKRRLNYEIGRTERKLTAIQGEKFGLLGDEKHLYTYLFDFVYRLISNVLSDAIKKKIVIGVESEDILARLKQDRYVFDAVSKPTLVHWDMWEGNVFVKDGQISGIIDWERAMWAEAFLDDRFRRHARNREFLKGYGQENFSKEEMRRICWYDVLLYLTMMTEGAYRGYPDDGQYQWTKPLFEDSWKELQI